MFLTKLKPSYRISHLYFDLQNQKILQQFKSAPSGPYNLPIKFIPSKEKYSLWNKLFLDRQLAKRFQQTIGFIQNCTTDSPQRNRQFFPHIEQHLASRIQSFIKSRPQEIIVHQCTVGRAFFLEQRKISGVFMHRKLNLAKSCYSTEFAQKSRQLKYRMKGKFRRSQDIAESERAKQLYQKQGYTRIYQDTYQGFQQSQTITRSLIKIVADLKVQIRVPQFQQSIRLGYDGASEHILQIQSYKVPYQEEEFVISDIDFFLEGNYHFLKEKN